MLLGSLLSEPLEPQFVLVDDEDVDPCEKEAWVELEEEWLKEAEDREGGDEEREEKTEEEEMEESGNTYQSDMGSYVSQGHREGSESSVTGLSPEDDLLIGVVVSSLIVGMPHIVEFGTSNGAGTLALALHGIEQTRVNSFDVTDRVLPIVKEGMAGRVEFRTIDSDDVGDSIMQVLRSEGLFVSQPAIVVVNPAWSGALQEAGSDFSVTELLLDILEPLPSSSVILMEASEYELVVSGFPGDAADFPFHVDVDFDAAREQLGSQLAAIRVTHSLQLQEFDVALLPPNATLASADLQPTVPLDGLDWLVFLRIPKCGTKSFTEVLKKYRKGVGCSGDFLTSPAYENRDCHIVTLCDAGIGRMLTIQVGKCHLIESHHCSWNDLVPAVDAYEVGKGGRSRTVTMLRDPIHRVISEFKHNSDSQRAWDYCPNSPVKGMTKEAFLAFLGHPDNAWGMRNRQTRMLAGCGTTEPCLLSDEELLDQAKHHLLQCDMVGLTEDFSSSMLLLSYAFGWTIRSYAIVSEAKDKKHVLFDIDDEVVEAITKLNDLDMQLYDFAQELVSHRLLQLRQRLMIDALPEYHCTEQAACIMFDPYHINWDGIWSANAESGGGVAPGAA